MSLYIAIFVREYPVVGKLWCVGFFITGDGSCVYLCSSIFFTSIGITAMMENFSFLHHPRLFSATNSQIPSMPICKKEDFSSPSSNFILSIQQKTRIGNYDIAKQQ